MTNRPQTAVIALVSWLSLCSFAAGETQETAEIAFFEKHIRPVLVEHCFECHSKQNEVQGGLSLDSRESILKGGDTGSVVIPGKPDESLLIKALRYSDPDLQMPPKQKLPADVIKSFETWVRRGAHDPRKESESTTSSKPTGMSIEEGREFWSFRPIQEPRIPEVKNRGWVQNPIDAFVLARLEMNSFTPASKANKRSLIRRVTLNLTGLPPTVASIEEFLQDESPDAFGKVVERLMASPHYGVHWGRHWLDVARYADSNGLDENLAFGHAWRYRDYVVEAFNSDKPYDRFITEQIAGDLLPAADRQTLTATSFLQLGAKVLAEPDRQKLDMDIIDEQIDATGKAFLGLTLGCVRCHDHKFDPIKQTDYYALAAIFRSTKSLAQTQTGVIKHWYEHSFATQEDKKRISEVEKELRKLKSAASAFKNEATKKIRAKAKQNAAKYLEIATQVSAETSLTDIAEIARPHGLHPRILHHCRLHLEFHQEEPFFKTWHELAKAGNTKAIRNYYDSLFQAVGSKKKGNASEFTSEEVEQAEKALNDPSGFLAIPAKEEHAFDTETLDQYYRLLDVAREFESRAPDLPGAMGVTEGVISNTLPIHIRGSYRNLGVPVPREFPVVLRTSEHRPVFPTHHSGRLQLAEWIASSRNPLTARVVVNRIWGWHFGQPLVQTTENFGVLGKRPSHPDLLDWLAVRFMKDGWSIKALNRLILNSSVYQMSFSHPEFDGYSEVDPENRLLWRANLVRLQAEAIRDSILAVSGELDATIGGKTVPLRNRQFVFNHTSEDHTKYDSHRRALYLPVVRNHVYTFFEQFNFPDPTMPTGTRSTTTVSPQALILMNSELVVESAEKFASAIVAHNQSEEERIRMAYLQALGREPSSAESVSAMEFVSAFSDEKGGNELQTWTLFCQSLFASNEFIYIR